MIVKKGNDVYNLDLYQIEDIKKYKEENPNETIQILYNNNKSGLMDFVDVDNIDTSKPELLKPINLNTEAYKQYKEIKAQPHLNKEGNVEYNISTVTPSEEKYNITDEVNNKELVDKSNKDYNRVTRNKYKILNLSMQKEIEADSKKLNDTILKKYVASPLLNVFGSMDAGAVKFYSDVTSLASPTLTKREMFTSVYLNQLQKYNDIAGNHTGLFSKAGDVWEQVKKKDVSGTIKALGNLKEEAVYQTFQSAPYSVVGIINPFVSGAMMFFSSYGQEALQLEQEHPELSRGAKFGVSGVTGVAEAASEIIGDTIQNAIVKEGIEEAVKKGIEKEVKHVLLRQALKLLNPIDKKKLLNNGIEGFEESISNGTQQLAEIVAGTRDKFNVTENMENFTGGFVSAMLMETPMRIGKTIGEKAISKKRDGKNNLKGGSDTQAKNASEYINAIAPEHLENTEYALKKAIEENRLQDAVGFYVKLRKDLDFIDKTVKTSEHLSELIEAYKDDYSAIGKQLQNMIELLPDEQRKQIQSKLDMASQSYKQGIDLILNREKTTINKDYISYIYNEEEDRIEYPTKEMSEKDKNIVATIAKLYDDNIIKNVISNTSDTTPDGLYQQKENLINALDEIEKSELSDGVKDKYSSALTEILFATNALLQGRGYEKTSNAEIEEAKNILEGEKKLNGSDGILELTDNEDEKKALSEIMNSAYFDDIANSKEVDKDDFINNINEISMLVKDFKNSKQILDKLGEYIDVVNSRTKDETDTKTETKIEEAKPKQKAYTPKPSNETVQKESAELDAILDEFYNANTIEDKKKIKEKFFNKINNATAKTKQLYYDKLGEMNDRIKQIKKTQPKETNNDIKQLDDLSDKFDKATTVKEKYDVKEEFYNAKSKIAETTRVPAKYNNIFYAMKKDIAEHSASISAIHNEYKDRVDNTYKEITKIINDLVEKKNESKGKDKINLVKRLRQLREIRKPKKIVKRKLSEIKKGTSSVEDYQSKADEVYNGVLDDISKIRDIAGVKQQKIEPKIEQSNKGVKNESVKIKKEETKSQRKPEQSKETNLQKPTESEKAQEQNSEVDKIIFNKDTNVKELNVSDIKVDPKKYQFRENTDKNGTDRRLEGAEYNKDLAGIIVVLQKENGDYYVINGHHRLDLAKKSGIDKILTRVLSYKNYTDNDAIGYGALINIAEGNATPIDVAKIIRNNIIPLEKLNKYVPKNLDIKRKGVALSKLQDGIFYRLITGKIKPERAVIIGELLGDNPDAQLSVLRLIEKQKKKKRVITNEVLREIIKSVKNSPSIEYEEGDMFGTEVIEKNLAIEKADIIAYVKNQLRVRKRILGAVNVKANKEILENLGNKLKDEVNVSEMSQADKLLFFVDKLAYAEGSPINEIINRYAKRYANAKDKNIIKREALKEISDILNKGVEYGSERENKKTNPNKSKGQRGLSKTVPEKEKGNVEEKENGVSKESSKQRLLNKEEVNKKENNTKTNEQITSNGANEQVHNAIKMLASVDDYATEQDGQGFNKIDTEFGNDLAIRKELTDKQALAGYKMIAKYKKQLAGMGIDYDRLPKPVIKEDKTLSKEELSKLSPKDKLAEKDLYVEKQGKYWVIYQKEKWHDKGTGKGTFENKDIFKKLGAKFNGKIKKWRFDYDPTESLAKAFNGDFSGVQETNEQRTDSKPSYDNMELNKIREAENARPDNSGIKGDIRQFVDDDTQQSIRKGEDVGIPKAIVNEQIEDIALINRAYQNNKGLFILANEAGSGKTFVIGGAIQQLKRTGAKKFLYVAMNNQLISQIKNDLKDFDISGVEFITYSDLSNKKISRDQEVVIFDEAQNIKNATKRGIQASDIIYNAEFTIFASATPFENPTEAAYLSPTKIFNRFGKNGFATWAKMYGASSKSFKKKNGEIGETLYWDGRGENKTQLAKEARDWFKKQGIFTQRDVKLPNGSVDVELPSVTAKKYYVDIYNKVTNYFDQAIDSAKEIRNFTMAFQLAGYKTNLQKRILESAKIDKAIEIAEQDLNDGKNPVIFIETKATRDIQPQKLIDKNNDWIASGRKGRRPVSKVLLNVANLLNDAGYKELKLESSQDRIVKHFGEDNVAIYTGDVSEKTANKNLEDWRNGKKKILVATMAKGGTGLSLHDKEGDHQTTQININLPWKASGVAQVSGRTARYGLKSNAKIKWIFAKNIPFDVELAAKVGQRMVDMGAVVKGKTDVIAEKIKAFDLESISESNGTIKKSQMDKVEPANKETDKIEDFGEVLKGAKKFTWTRHFIDFDINEIDKKKDLTIDKIFPSPDYAKIAEEQSKVMASLMYYARENIKRILRKKNRYNIEFVKSEINPILGMVKRILIKDINGLDVITLLEREEHKGILDKINIISLVDFNNIPKDLMKYSVKTARYLSLVDADGDKVYRHYSLEDKTEDGKTFKYYKRNGKTGKLIPLPNMKTEDVIQKEENVIVVQKGVTTLKRNFKTKKDAYDWLEKYFSELDEKKRGGIKFGIYFKNNIYSIVKKVSSRKYITVKSGFKSLVEARDYLSKNQSALEETLKDLKKIPDTRRSKNEIRVGIDYTNGKNITPELFTKTFGFRGVQFGNWVENKRRQQDLIEAYNGLYDLAETLGIPTRALSLNGTLGLAFGARGSGNAMAHYESGQVVINLTKTKGAGSLAHEWFHSLDNYFGKQLGYKDYITDSPYEYNTRQGKTFGEARKEVVEAFAKVVTTIRRETKVADRSMGLDLRRIKDYWSTITEMGARSFERYIIDKLEQKGYSNDYLANIVDYENFVEKNSYPYPLDSEIGIIGKAFDNLFNIIKTKETDSGVALYKIGKRKEGGEIHIPTKTTNKTNNKFLNKLKTAFPNIEVKFYKSIDDKVNDKDGVVYGYVKGGKIYLNEDNINPNTIMHEYSHIFVQILKVTHEDTYTKLINKILTDKDLIAQKKGNPYYSGLSDNVLADEVLADLMGNKSDTLLNENKPIHKKIIELLQAVWNKIKNLMSKGSVNISKWDTEVFKNATFDDIANDISANILNGKIVSRLSSDELNERININKSIQNLINQINIPSLNISVIEKPRLQAFMDLDSKTKFYKKKFGETVAKIIRSEMPIAFDRHEELAKFIKEKIPLKKSRAFILDKIASDLEKEFLDKLSGKYKENDNFNYANPLELLRDVGYNSTIVENPYIAKPFITYYKGEGSNNNIGGSIICTFNNVAGRIRDNIVLFVVTDDAKSTMRAEQLTQDNLNDRWKRYLEKVGRKNDDGTYNLEGLKNHREDPFSLSVLSIQINRNGERHKIISRYNHTIHTGNVNPDAVYGGNLDKIAHGLTNALYEYFSIKNKLSKIAYLSLPDGITKDNKNRFYHYGGEVNGVYYGDGFYIKNNGDAVLLNKDKQRMVDGFVFDQSSNNVLNVSDNYASPFYKDVKAEKIHFIGKNNIRVTTKYGDVEFPVYNGASAQCNYVSKELVKNVLYTKEDKNGKLIITRPSDYIHLFWHEDIIEIKGKMLLQMRNITDFKGLEKFGGDIDFGDSKITSLGKLKYIGGYALFNNSKITSLGNLEYIGDNIDFGNSKITSLGNLEHIGGDIDFRNSKITSLGKLKYIGGETDFSNSKITSLGNLEYIGGETDFGNSKITSLGKLKYIGGNAWFGDSKITSLGKLKYIGGNAWFDNSKITSLGNLEYIGGHAWFGNYKITSLGNLEYIGSYSGILNNEQTQKLEKILFNSKKNNENSGVALYRKDNLQKAILSSNKNVTEKEKQEISDMVASWTGNKNIVGFVDKIMTSDGGMALGKYQNGLIEIANGNADAKDTAMHETVHWVLDMLMRDENGVANAELQELEQHFQNEEDIAEGIIEYANKTKTFKGKVGRIIDKIIRTIKSMFGKERGIDKLHNFYDRLMKGYYAGNETTRGTQSVKTRINTVTENFKKWFGKSKVVDKNGNPRIMYHGTKAGRFYTFKSGYKHGLIFFSNLKFATNWGETRNVEQDWELINSTQKRMDEYVKKTGMSSDKFWSKYYNDESFKEKHKEIERLEYVKRSQGVNIVPVYIRAENPFNPETAPKRILKILADTKRFKKFGFISINDLKKAGFLFFENDGIVNILRNEGYDSIELIESEQDKKRETLAVFSPTQIKSIYNDGTFGIDNPDIRYRKIDNAQKGMIEGTYEERKSVAKKMLDDGYENDDITRRTGFEIIKGKLKQRIEMTASEKAIKDANLADRSKYTAKSRKTVPVPIKSLINNNQIKGSVLHFGSGKDTNSSDAIGKVASNVSNYDPAFANDRALLTKQYDTVVANNVIDVLPKQYREYAIKDISAATKNKAFISVGINPKLENTTKYDDGVVTSNNIFKKVYTPEELLKELSPYFDNVKILEVTNSYITVEATNTPSEKMVATSQKSKAIQHKNIENERNGMTTPETNDLSNIKATTNKDALRYIIDHVLSVDEKIEIYNSLKKRNMTVEEFINGIGNKRYRGFSGLSKKITHLLNIAVKNGDAIDELYYKVQSGKLHGYKIHSQSDKVKLFTSSRRFANHNNINISSYDIANKFSKALYGENIEKLSTSEMYKLSNIIANSEYKDGRAIITDDTINKNGNIFSQSDIYFGKPKKNSKFNRQVVNEVNSDLEKVYYKIENRGNEKIRLPRVRKLYNTFVEMMDYVAIQTNSLELTKTIRNYAENLVKFNENRDALQREFGNKYIELYKKIDDNISREIIDYLDKGKPLSSKNSEYTEMAKHLKMVMDSTKGMVAKQRIKKWFEGRLKDGAFSKAQLAILKKWNDTYHFKDKKLRTGVWFDFLDNIKNLTNEGANEFIYKNYFPHKKEASVELDKEYEINDMVNDDNVNFKNSYMKKREKNGIVKEADPVRIVFNVYDTVLRAELLEDYARGILKIAKENIVRSDANKVIEMLKMGLGLREPKNRLTKRLDYLMGNAFKVMALKGQMPAKNFFQRLLNMEHVSDIRDLFKGKKSYFQLLKENGASEYYARYLTEMTQKYGINELYAMNLAKQLTQIKDIKDVPNTKELGVWLFDRFLRSDAMFDPANKAMINLHKFADTMNRANGMYIFSERVYAAFNKNDSWKSIKKAIGFDSLTKGEQYYLMNTYKTNGLNEFVYQYAKLKTITKQYEYLPALKSLYHTNYNYLVRSFLKYSTWSLSFQKDFYRNIGNITKGNDAVRNTEQVIMKVGTGIAAKVILSMLFGNLMNDDDLKDSIVEAVKGFFNPSDWRGSWNLQTIMPLDARALTKILNGERIQFDDARGIMGFPAYIVLETALASANMASYTMASLRGDTKNKEKAHKAIAYHLHNGAKSTSYLYNTLSAIYSSFLGKENYNVFRLTDDSYNAKDSKRGLVENIQYLVFRAHKPNLGKGKNLTPKQLDKLIKNR